MTLEEQKLNRMSYLEDILIKYTTTEPRLTNDDIAMVLSETIEDLNDFIKKYKKELKK